MSTPKKTKPVLNMDSKIQFGKYKNFTIRDVISEDPAYIDWCIGEQLVELDNFAYTALQIELKSN